MAHFAELDDLGIVQRVVVVANEELLGTDGSESEAKGVAFCQALLGGTWVQTSYNRSFRKRFASIGDCYDPGRDAFVPPKPYQSWVLDEETYDWLPPIPPPSDGLRHAWDEEHQRWL